MFTQIVHELWDAIRPAVYTGLAAVLVRVLLLLSTRVKNTTIRQDMEALALAVDKATAAEYQRTVKALKDPDNTGAGEWNPDAARIVKRTVMDVVRAMVPPVLESLKRRGYNVDLLLDVELERSVGEQNERRSSLRPPPFFETPSQRPPPPAKVPALEGPRRSSSGAVFQAVKSAISADATGQTRLPKELRDLPDTSPETPGGKKGRAP